MALTTEQRAAARIERDLIETRRIADIAEAAANLASVRRMNLPWHNTQRLWAEFDFYKAMKAWDGDGTYDDAFADVCHSLGVDEEGEELPPDPADYGDWRYEQMRDRELDRMIDREGL